MTGPKIKAVPNHAGGQVSPLAAGKYAEAIVACLKLAQRVAGEAAGIPNGKAASAFFIEAAGLPDRMQDEVHRVLGVRYQLPEG